MDKESHLQVKEGRRNISLPWAAQIKLVYEYTQTFALIHLEN